jgi:uncharacterized repeat protein (TIGR01451 family)
LVVKLVNDVFFNDLEVSLVAMNKSVMFPFVRAWRLLAILLIGALEMSAAWAQAGQPLYCDAQFYQTRVNAGGTILLRYPTLNTAPVNVYTGTNAATAVPGLAAVTLNGLGFNHRDNYLYAITTSGTAGNVSLYRMGQTGSELVGNIPGVSNPFTTTAGVFDKQGRYYFAGQGGAIAPYSNTLSPAIIYRVDNIPPTGTSGALTIARSYNINVTPLLNFGDFAFSDTTDGINGVLYGTSNQITPASPTGTRHVRIVLNDAAATASVTVLNVTGENTAGTGSAFYDRPTNRFYMFSNVNNAFYEIVNFAAGTPNAVSTTAVLNAPLTNATGTSDGTACIFATVQQADIGLTKSVTPATPRLVGQTVSFIIGASNIAPSSPAQSVTIADPLPPGMTFVSATTTAGTYFPGTSNWVIPSLPAGTSQTLTIVASVNSLGTTTASYVNVASVNGSNQAGTTTVIPLTDPNSTNNTATATVTTTRAANLQISKTNAINTPTALIAGQTTNYTITVSLGSSTTATDVANAVLRDPVAPGLNCVLGTAPICSASVGSICPTVGAGAGQLSIANLQGAGVLIPLLKVGGTMTFRVSCGVTASGQ